MSDNGTYGTWSFADFHLTMITPTGAVNVSELGIADEGVTITMRDPKNTMTTGADGSVMHSLRVADAGTITIRAQKTGVINSLLMDNYRQQKLSSAYWGRNLFRGSNPVAGDTYDAKACAFQKLPDNVNATEGNINEWVFDCGKITQVLGDGLSL